MVTDGNMAPCSVFRMGSFAAQTGGCDRELYPYDAEGFVAVLSRLIATHETGQERRSACA